MRALQAVAAARAFEPSSIPEPLTPIPDLAFQSKSSFQSGLRTNNQTLAFGPVLLRRQQGGRRDTDYQKNCCRCIWGIASCVAVESGRPRPDSRVLAEEHPLFDNQGRRPTGGSRRL